MNITLYNWTFPVGFLVTHLNNTIWEVIAKQGVFCPYFWKQSDNKRYLEICGMRYKCKSCVALYIRLIHLINFKCDVSFSFIISISLKLCINMFDL